MNQRRSHRIRNQNLKTEVGLSLKSTDVQLGKFVRLPYIRKNNHPNHNQRKSLETKESFVMKNSNKQLNLMEYTNINMLTLQQIQLCKESSLEKQGFPKIHARDAVLPRERSIEALEMSLRGRDKKSLTKLEFTDKVGEYRLGHVVGKGTYSVVRLGTNKKGKRVAVKIYLKSSLSSQDRTRNLHSQINVLYSLQPHQSIIAFHEHIQTESAIHLVSQLLQNRSMWDYLKGECFQTVPEDIAKYMIKQLTKAISYCHSKDIVHRDIKMENVLIDKEFKIKLIDFGFSLQLPKQNHLLNDYCGTPSYIAPQIAQREGYYGKPADIWSLGVIIFRMVAGSFPYKNGKPTKNQLKIPGQLSAELSNILAQMLAVDFNKRPTADQILVCEWLTK